MAAAGVFWHQVKNGRRILRCAELYHLTLTLAAFIFLGNSPALARFQDVQAAGENSSASRAQDRTNLDASAVARTEQELAMLVQKEQALLIDFGPEHPEVLAIRAQIKQTRVCLARAKDAISQVAAINETAPSPRQMPEVRQAQFVTDVHEVAPAETARSAIEPWSAGTGTEPTEAKVGTPTKATAESAPLPSRSSPFPDTTTLNAPAQERLQTRVAPEEMVVWWPVGSALGIMLMSSLVQAGMLVVIVRRLGALPIPIAGAPNASRSGQPRANETDSAAASPLKVAGSFGQAGEFTAQSKDDAKPQQEAAVLRHILEQNLLLREQIEMLPATA